MIKSFSATTREIDDAEAACAEITATLDLEKNMLKNSLGIISCFSEFNETGVLRAICDSLPFDCIGATTCLSSSCREMDQIIFSITVLTSDDCSFQTIEIPVTENFEDSAACAISEKFKEFKEPPKLLLTYFPLLWSESADKLLAKIDRATSGIPLFGTIAVDHTIDFSTSKTILNGTMYNDTIILGAIYGNLKCSFEVASLDESKIRKQKAIITESEGNTLITVNGIPAFEYFEEIGLTRAELTRGIGVVPLVVDHNDGTIPIARGVYTLTPEDHVVCGGSMPAGSTIALGRLDMEDILKTTEKTLTSFAEKDCVILCYSCMARYFALGAHSTAEVEKFVEIMGDSPYLFAYSGGEICPLPDKQGCLKNYYHSYTIVFCKLS